MLLIRCPFCGGRPETEFSYGGEAHISRPPDPSAVDDAAWTDFLDMRTIRRCACRTVAAHKRLRAVLQLPA